MHADLDVERNSIAKRSIHVSLRPRLPPRRGLENRHLHEILHAPPHPPLLVNPRPLITTLQLPLLILRLLLLADAHLVPREPNDRRLTGVRGVKVRFPYILIAVLGHMVLVEIPVLDPALHRRVARENVRLEEARKRARELGRNTYGAADALDARFLVRDGGGLALFCGGEQGRFLAILVAAAVKREVGGEVLLEWIEVTVHEEVYDDGGYEEETKED